MSFSQGKFWVSSLTFLHSIFSFVSLSGTPVWMMDFHDWSSNFPFFFFLLFSSFILLSYFWEDVLQSFYWVFNLWHCIFNLLEPFCFVLFSKYSFLYLPILVSWIQCILSFWEYYWCLLEVFLSSCIFYILYNSFPVCLVWSVLSYWKKKFFFGCTLHGLSCGILVLWPGIEPGQWKHGVLTTGQRGNSLKNFLNLSLLKLRNIPQ